MSETTSTLGFNVRLQGDWDAVLERVAAALKAEGFGILTEIDVKDTFKQKLGVDFRRYKILGACNPPLAHQALSAAPETGLLLPCNVTVADAEDGAIEVNLVNPEAMLAIIDNPALEPVARDARARLERVAQALRG